MTLAELPAWAREALAVHEAFRRLEFAAEVIFLRPQDPPAETQVVLMTQGVDFSVAVGAADAREVERLWPVAAATWVAAPEVECLALWAGSAVSRRSVDLILALLAKGFRLGGRAEKWART